MDIVLFFTYDYSLKLWDETGILSREKIYFQKLLDTDKDLKLTLVTYGGKSDLNYLLDMPRLRIIPVYTLLTYSNIKLLRYLKSFLIPFYLNKSIKNLDIIKQFQLQGAWVSIIYKFITRKPIIIRTGYDMYKFSIEEGKSLFKKLMYRILTKVSIKFSNCYTVSSKADKDFLHSTFKLKDKEIKIRPNWVLQKDYVPLSKRKRTSLLAIGRLEYQKNYTDLIKIFKNTDYEIDIYGEGSLKKDLLELSADNSVKANFKGLLSYEDLIEEYKKYSFFLSASIYEGNPKTILEALSSGCIVIAIDEKNIREIIEDNKTGFLVKDSEQILIKLNQLLSDDKKMNFISKNAYQKISDSNNIDVLVDKDISDFYFILKSFD
jgi:glycosyltransferase involved in cell wall biosynthesis